MANGPNFSIWESDACGISLVNQLGPPCFASGQVEDPGAVKVLEFYAATWDEACQRRNDYYGWGRHEPNDEWGEVNQAT